MRRPFRLLVLFAVAFSVLATFAGSAHADDSASQSGVYDGQSTLTSFTPAPAGSPDPAAANKRPKSPTAGSVVLDCTGGRACSTYYAPYDSITLTRLGANHLHGHAVYPDGCKWSAPQPVAEFDIRISGNDIIERASTQSGVYVSRCPGQEGTNRFYMPGAVWEFRGTRHTSPGGVPGSTPTGPGGASGSAGGAAITGGSGSASRVAAMSPRQLDNLTAVQAGRLSTVPGSLQSPSEAFKNAGRVAQNAALAAILVLLLVFPSQLFNSTFDAHHERILAAWRARFGRTTKGEGARRESTRARRTVTYLAVVFVGAVLAGFLDPHFGFKTASYALLAGVLASTLFGAGLGGLINRGYRSARHHSTSVVLVAVPAGLAIALACVVVSRWAHFQPGYLYGLVGGFSFVVALDKLEAGRAHFVGFVIGLLVATTGWMLFVPVSRAANNAHAGFGVLVIDAFLSAIFIGGIEGALFSLVPLRFLPGHDVARWSWIAWGALAFATSFLFVDALLRPETGYLGQSSTASAVVTYGLFTFFALGSVAFWGWFRTHPDPPLAAAPAAAA